MEEPPRAQSVMQTRSSNLQVRASKIIQKVSNFRGRIRLPSRKTKDDRDMQGPYMRQSHSMDVHAKPYMSQPMLGLSNVPTDDDSSQSASPNHSPLLGEFRPMPPLTAQLTNRLPRHSISTGLVSSTHIGVTGGGRGVSLDGLPSAFEGPSHPPTSVYPSGTHNLSNQEHNLAAPPTVVSKPSILRRRTLVEEPSGANLPMVNEGSEQLANNALTQVENQLDPTPIQSSKPVRLPGDSKSPLQTLPASSTAERQTQSHNLHKDAKPSLIPPPGLIPVPNPTSPQPTTITYSSSPKLPSTTLPTGSSTSPPAQVPHTPPPTSNSTFPPRRTPAPRMNGLPLPLHRFSLSMTDSGTARLSPSIVTRQAPIPILHLPTLPPPSPKTAREDAEREQTNHRKAGSQVRLKSLPALPIQGTEDEEMEDDGDEGEIDDDDDGETSEMGHRDPDMPVDMDDDDDDVRPGSSMSSENGFIPPRSGSQSPSNSDSSLSFSDHQQDPRSLTPVDTSRTDLSFLSRPPDLKRKGTGKGKEREHGHQRSRESDSTPTASQHRHQHQYHDYFSSNSPGLHHDARPSGSHPTGESSERTPRPGDTFHIPGFSVVEMPNTTSPVSPITLAPPMSGPCRPGIYNQASKSMVDILTLGKRETMGEVVAEEGKVEVDLERQSMPKGKEKASAREDSEATVTSPGSSKADSPAESLTTPVYETNAASRSLRRRRSMPSFTAASVPPPYPSFAPHPYAHPMRQDIVIQPRDDELEGKERLPAYSNAIYMKAVMPRKMEFTKPGVQAKDRKWRRVLCVLEGTMFRVYRCPPGAGGVGVIGEWWEKKVGAADITLEGMAGTSGGQARVAGVNQTEPVAKLGVRGNGGGGVTGNGDSQSEILVRPRSPQPQSQSQFQDQPEVQPRPQASRSRLNLAVNILKPGRPHSRSQSDIPSPPKPRAASRSSFSILRPTLTASSSASGSASGDSASGQSNARSNSPSLRPTPSNLSIPSSVSTSVSTPVTAAPSPSSSRSLFQGVAHTPRVRASTLSLARTTTLPEDPANLIRVYTLQHAESGLGSDYTKRKNVIRVRLEGEQFLLQAKDVPGVVEWIEGFTAATNIALDLDERVMPKGPLFPRRRRRRAARGNEGASNSQSQPPDNRTT